MAVYSHAGCFSIVVEGVGVAVFVGVGDLVRLDVAETVAVRDAVAVDVADRLVETVEVGEFDSVGVLEGVFEDVKLLVAVLVLLAVEDKVNDDVPVSVGLQRERRGATPVGGARARCSGGVRATLAAPPPTWA